MKHLAIALITLAALAYAQEQPAGLLLVANQGDHSLSIIDPEAGTLIAKVTSNEIRGHEVEASADGRFAYLPIYGDSGVGLPGSDGHTIELIDLEKRAVTKTIDLGRPVRPHCIKLGRDGLMYVTAELAQAVDVIDPKTQRKIASIPTGRPESHMLVFTKDGKRAYTSNVGSGTVSVLDLKKHKLITVISVADIAQRISISVDDKFVFTADQQKPRLAVIDTSTNKVLQWVPLPSMAYGTAPTRDGKWLLVTLPQANRVGMLNLATMKLERTVEVPARPVEILVREDALVAYVSCSGDGKVAVIDLKELRVEKILDSGPGADGLAWAARK